MAEYGLPPWLEARPTDTAESLTRGLQLGMEMREARDRHQMAQQQIGMEQQRLAASERNTALEAQIRRETIIANFQRAQTQTAMTKAYHDAQLGLEKGRLDLETQKLEQATQEKVAALADRQGYALAIASGMKPAEALAKYPRAWTPGLAIGESKPVEQSVTEHFKEVTGQPADITPAHERSYLNPMRYISGPTAPAVTNAPAIEGHPAYSVTRKIPAGVSPADAFKENQMPDNAAPQTFKKGQRAQQDGVTYEFDGQNWTEVK